MIGDWYDKKMKKIGSNSCYETNYFKICRELRSVLFQKLLLYILVHFV